MPPKGRFFPIFLLSVFVLFFYSHFHSIPISSDNLDGSTNLSLRLNPSQDLHLASNFSLTIKILAYNRLSSLSRCLQSLANADYGNDRVNIHIFIDHFKELNPENQSEILNEKLGEAHQMLDFVDQFVWTFGDKFVHYRTVNVGLQAQWLEVWWPSSDDEFAFVVEDDLEVSPLFYRFLRSLISNFYYNSSNFSPSIYGASLQRPRFVAGKHGNKLELDNKTRLFLYQIVGTWGQLLFPRPWKEFRIWYDRHKNKGMKPILQGMVTTGWYKKMGERIWTPWFIKFIQSRGYYNIYTNFGQERALSVSHRDAGVNYGSTAGPDSQLLNDSPLDFNLWEIQPLETLKWYDFCFSEVIPSRVVRSVVELESLLNSVSQHHTVIVVSLYGTPEPIVRNLLCHFERLNVHNYILMGTWSDFLLDLARRGHPVVDADSLSNDIRRQKMRGLEVLDVGFIREIVAKAVIIRKCLEVGYSLWLFDGNMVPIGEGFPANPSDSFVGKDKELLFVRSSQIIKNIWDEKFVSSLASEAKSLAYTKSHSKDVNSFGSLVSKCLEEKGMTVKGNNFMSFMTNLDVDSSNKTFLDDRKQLMFWPSEMSLDSVQKRLQDIGMWVIDGDLSCTAVSCHRS